MSGVCQKGGTVSRFSIDLNAEVYVDLNCTVQEGQTVFFYVFSGKFDLILRIVEVH